LSTYNEQRVAKLLYQVVSALAYLHSKNIVHRDLKPENLLFVDESANIIKLCDFGVAERIPERGYLTEVIGTESYMAPEVEHGKPYGVSSDMYGLGVIMYIMLCGYPPFEPENGIVELEFPAEEWANISSTVKELITLLLEHDPEKRPSAQEVLKNSWICGESAKKDELQETLSTMKIFNLSRISDSISSMRVAKANKKDVVWSIFSSGYAKIARPSQHPSNQPKPLPKPLPKVDKKKPLKKSKAPLLSPRGLISSPEKKNSLSSSGAFRVPEIPPIMNSIIPPSPESAKLAQDENPIGTVDPVLGRDPDELVQTISLLESKLLSLSNVNCALQTEIDEISVSFNKLKFEQYDLLQQLDETLQEIETLKKKQKKDKK